MEKQYFDVDDDGESVEGEREDKEVLVEKSADKEEEKSVQSDDDDADDEVEFQEDAEEEKERQADARYENKSLPKPPFRFPQKIFLGSGFRFPSAVAKVVKAPAPALQSWSNPRVPAPRASETSRIEGLTGAKRPVRERVQYERELKKIPRDGTLPKYQQKNFLRPTTRL